VGTRAGLMGSRSENILATVPGEASSVEVISGPPSGAMDVRVFLGA
jgi:hypothetical protein